MNHPDAAEPLHGRNDAGDGARLQAVQARSVGAARHALAHSARFVIEATEVVGETRADAATRSTEAMVMAARSGGVAIEIGIARAGLVASEVGWVEPG